MADIFSKKRTQIRASISRKETKPIFSIKKNFAFGFHYLKNLKHFPGKSEIVFPKSQTVILIYGCLWHGHFCKKATRPTSNMKIWNSKIESNRRRYREVLKGLKREDWKVITIWECELNSKKWFDKVIYKISSKLII